jgi:predicted HicB family RNase H-like nuclease
MEKNRERHSRERMIHIRLDEHTHRQLKILAARTDASVQSVVENLIRLRLDGDPNTSGRTRKNRGEK